MHTQHREGEKRLDLRTRVEKLKYLPIYIYIYLYARMYMKVHKFATRHSQPERDTDCGKLFAK